MYHFCSTIVCSDGKIKNWEYSYITSLIQFMSYNKACIHYQNKVDVG